MTASAVSIASNALLMLGDKPIAALEEGSDRARLAANLWPTVRSSVLRAHPWNCAIRRVSLAPLATGPAFDWAYTFPLPADFLRALSVGERGAEVEFQIEGRDLLCDTNPALLRYVFDNDNPATYDSMLVDLLTVTLAHRMSYAITDSASTRQAIADDVERMARRARSVDGQEDSASWLGDSPLMSARFGSLNSARLRG